MTSKPKPYYLRNVDKATAKRWGKRYCERCKHDHFYQKPCSILMQAIEGKKPPSEHIYNKHNSPVCTAFELDPELETHWADDDS